MAAAFPYEAVTRAEREQALEQRLVRTIDLEGDVVLEPGTALGVDHPRRERVRRRGQQEDLHETARHARDRDVARLASDTVSLRESARDEHARDRRSRLQAALDERSQPALERPWKQ
ncbi:MAG: hypothetical protein LC720_03880 [Actinobacteria bacterium]|nr:hypothetical protein [Actinomycetota bacterium]